MDKHLIYSALAMLAATPMTLAQANQDTAGQANAAAAAAEDEKGVLFPDTTEAPE